MMCEAVVILLILMMIVLIEMTIFHWPVLFVVMTSVVVEMAVFHWPSSQCFEYRRAAQWPSFLSQWTFTRTFDFFFLYAAVVERVVEKRHIIQ